MELSWQQRRILANERNPQLAGSYNMPACFRLALRNRQPLDDQALVTALESAVAGLCRMHAILGSRFPEPNGMTAMEFDPDLRPQLHFHDWTLPGAGGDLHQVYEDVSRRPFDLAQGPLWSLTGIRLTQNQYAIILVMHHIISDGYSFAILMRQLVMLMAARLQGLPLPLLICRQYHDMVEAPPSIASDPATYLPQISLITTPMLDRALPLARGYSRQADFITHTLEFPLHARMIVLCKRLKLTLERLLLAAHVLHLAARLGSNTVYLELPVANRTTSNLDVVGYVANAVLFVLPFHRHCTIREFLSQVCHQFELALACADIPFPHALDLLERQLTDCPQTRRKLPFMLNFLPRSNVYAEFGDMTLEVANYGLGSLRGCNGITAHYDMLMLWQLPQKADPHNQPFVNLVFDSALYDDARADAFYQDFLICLQQLVRGCELDPDQLLAGLDGDEPIIAY